MTLKSVTCATFLLGLVLLSGCSVFARPLFPSTSSFGSSINLSNNPGSSTLPVIGASGRNVYVAWEDNTTGTSEIFFKASNNNGTSFGSTINLSNDVGGAYNEQISASGNYVYVVWQDNSLVPTQIFTRISADNGTNFATPINLSNSKFESVNPQVVASGKNVYVVWQESTTTKGSGSPDIFFSNSSSNGSRFLVTPINLSVNAGNSLTPQIAAAQNMVYVTWRDDTSGTSQTWFKSSSNNGATFGGSVNLSSDTSTSINQQIAAQSNNVYVSWERNTVGKVDIFLRASNNRGTTFNTATNASNTGRGTVPQLAAAGSDVYLAWRDFSLLNSQIFFRASTDNATSFSRTINLSNDTTTDTDQSVAAYGSSVFISWDDTSQTYLIGSSATGAGFNPKLNLSNDLGTAVNPVVMTIANNIYAAWQDNTPGQNDIFFVAGTLAAPDVAISAVSLSRLFAYNGVTSSPVTFNVTAANNGAAVETFNVTAFANSTVIGIAQIAVSPSASLTVSFSWHPELLPRGNYTLSAQASSLPGETNLANNVLTDGILTVRLAGDVDNNCKVNVVDLATVAIAYSSTPGASNWNPYADLDNNGVVNVVDLATTAINYGKAC